LTSSRKRQAVIVLGMHRSGTSAVAGVLSLMGAGLPARLMPPGPGNPKGYFEPGYIVTIHDRVLAAAGTSWAGWELISESWQRSEACRPFVDELAAAVVEDWGTSGLFVVKDPRMCRLMPLWFRVLEQVGVQASFVLPFRNPVEVARSVQRREGLPLPHGCVAWLRCVLDAERQSRGHPRAFLSYADLVADPRSAIERAIAPLAVDWPRPLGAIAAEVREFVDPGLRHEVADAKAIDDMGDVSPWLHQALDHYAALAHGGDDGVPARIDALRAQFDAADALFTPAFRHDADLRTTERQRETERHAALTRSLSEREQEVAGLRGTLAGSETKVAALDEALRKGEVQRAALEQVLSERAAEIAQRDARLASLDRTLAERDDQNRALWGTLAQADARVASLQATIKTLRRSASWRVTAPLRFLEDSLPRLRFSAPIFPLILGWQACRTRSRLPLRDWRDARVIARSGQFDRSWYVRRYPDVAAMGIDPVRHYVAFGAKEGRDPSPSFSGAWYLVHHPDVAAAGLNPFAHYVMHGAKEGRALAPAAASGPDRHAEPVSAPPIRPGAAVAQLDLFARLSKAGRDECDRLYASRETLEADCRLLRDSGLFDPDTYRAAAGIDVSTDAIEHYLREGWHRGHEPGPGFQGTFLYPYYCGAGHVGAPAIAYLKLRAAGGPAYATYGEAERWAAVIRSSALFECERYAAKLDCTCGLDPALHYVLVGEVMGLSPSDSFDPVYYRRRYPDLAQAGVNLLGHYVTSGRREGRRPVSVAAQLAFDRSRLRSGRKVVVVISHEASRTGAPILAWNIAEHLSRDYDVVAVLLGGGELVGSFADTCAAVIGPLTRDHWHPVEAELIARRLSDFYSIAYAIANSTESRLFVPALATARVPVVSLIHEFAAYTRPKGALGEGLRWSTEIVFSTEMTAAAAVRETPRLADRRIHVLPQGRCALPGAPKMSAADRDRLREIFRPEGRENALVVLGAGFVHIRKGVDLFLACAATVAAAHPKRPVRFIWIGNGYDLVNDPGYSTYLGEQIARSQLEETVAIIDAIEDIEPAFELADVFFLSSRLDPLPNVTIDSAFHGMPVICFEGATGMATLLAADPGLRRCVVPHLDVHAAASVIVEFADDVGELERLGADIRGFAQKTFDMAAYVRQLDELGRNGIEIMRQRRQDFATIRDDSLFDQSMFCPPGAARPTREEAIWQFLSRWAAVGMSRKPALDFFFRRPCPGFHPQIYAQENAGRFDSSVVNPLAHFIRSGKPDGPWRHEVVTPSADEPTRTTGVRAALHGHFYYPDLMVDLLNRLAVNRSQLDLLLSTDTLGKKSQLYKALRHYANGKVIIRVVPNRGRDIGPFLAEFNDVIPGYDVVGHVHAKRSVFAEGSADPTLGDRRRNFLWQSLIGDARPMADAILERFDRDAKLGIVFPEDPTLADWDDNLELAMRLVEKMKFADALPPFFEFPGGTMFWARPGALKALFELKLDWNDFPGEPLPEDGTILHAIERLLPLVARHAGYGFLTTRVPGVTW
jgi:glycosyltransferase involved in cell wall biosynthesis